MPIICQGPYGEFVALKFNDDYLGVPSGVPVHKLTMEQEEVGNVLLSIGDTVEVSGEPYQISNITHDDEEGLAILDLMK